jgi:hypothetical protein
MSSEADEIKECVIEGCSRHQFDRGLCNPCWQAARRRIRKSKGKLTWEMLEEAGLALPDEPTVRKNANPAVIAIEKAGLLNEVSTQS